MKWQDLSDQDCSVARTLAVIGDRWTLMILRDLFLGATRFEDFQRSLGISRTILSERLQLLESEGVVRKMAYQEKPTRYKYRLTSKGVDLHGVMLTIVGWGDKYYAGDAGPPVVYRHSRCDHLFTPVLTCSDCGEEVTPFETRVEPGPGYPELLEIAAQRNRT
jgi:DNA-binding HxlR family transcriptional regulator